MPSYTTGMEKVHFGDREDGNANMTTEFPLDFLESMLQTADGAVHHQINEFYQPGPAARQCHQLGSAAFQESICFPALPFPAAWFANSSAAPNFHYLPEEKLQASTANAKQQRTPGNGPQLQAGDGFAPGHGLQTSMGSCIDCSFSNLGRATVQYYAPEKSSLETYSSTPDSLAYMIPMPREFSGYETSCSPNNLKRAAGCETANSQQLHRGIKSQKVTIAAVPDYRQVLKSKLPTDQAEHILRERIRREVMTSKFRKLESLIPPGRGPKRDRATIVEESIAYVKNLHHRLKDLQKKRSEMKSSRATSFVKKCYVRRPGHNKVTGDNNTNVSSPSESNGTIALAKTSIEKVEVHLDLPHEIVIEITCRPHGRSQSKILEALERLQMDVLRCSISKLHGLILCFVVVKPRVLADPPITSDDVIRTLKLAIVAKAL